MEEQAEERGPHAGLLHDSGVHGVFHRGEEHWASFVVKIGRELSIGIAHQEHKNGQIRDDNE